ncbi:hypothetical protein D9M71_382940 [compost metagenome]
MERIPFQGRQNFAPTNPRRRRNCQKHFLCPGLIDQLLDMLGLVDLQASDGTSGDAVVIVDESHRPHGSPHSQGCDQLVPCRSRPIHRYPRQPIVLGREWHCMAGDVPIPKEILAHSQTQAADKHQTQPPIIEHHRTRHIYGRLAVPINDKGQKQ